MNFVHEENRIYMTDNNRPNEAVAEVTFRKLSDHLVSIDHTYVEPSLRGQGIAGNLMEETIKHLRDNNMSARATCSYAVKWFQEHPEARDVFEK